MATAPPAIGRLSARTLAAALTAGTVAIALAIALWDFSLKPGVSLGYLLYGWWQGVAYLLPSALLVGLPLALRWLRDPAEKLWRWAGVGAIAGAAGGLFAILWVSAQYGFKPLFTGEGLLLVLGSTMLMALFGLASAALARPIALILGRRNF